MDRDQTSNSLFNDDSVLHTTWLYHQEDRSRAEVAAIMGVPHVTVVRYLQTARESGLVHINLDVNVFGSIDAALQICDRFSLQRVIIVPDDEHARKRGGTRLMRTRLSRTGSMYPDQVIENGDALGVTQGGIIRQVSKTMTPKLYKGVTAIQMLGSMSPQSDLTIIESSSQIVYKLSGRVTSLHMSVVVPSTRLAIELQAESIIQSDFDVLTHCTKAFSVVGNALDENPLIRVGILNKRGVQMYRDLGAVSIIHGRFYDKEEVSVVADVNQCIPKASLAQPRQIERKIFLAGGERGYNVTLGALLGGYVTGLIADEGTAEFLLVCKLPHQGSK